jgi:hypothetical protein
MTRHAYVPFAVAFAVCVASFVGCDVETQSQPPLSYPPANRVVINEVFALPASNANAHSWLEIYNPTGQTVNLKKWSLSFRTTRIQQTTLVYYDTVGHRGSIQPVPGLIGTIYSALDSVFDVPIYRLVDSLTLRVIPIAGAPVDLKLGAPNQGNLNLRPNEFLTLVNDIDRLRVYNTIGPGRGPEPASSPFLPLTQNNVVYQLVLGRDTLPVSLPSITYRAVTYQRDTLLLQTQRRIPDSLYTYIFIFSLGQTGQIVLKDSVGNTVDVVRYGNYTFTGPGADPYPGNQSVGIVPEYESVARYAGAYDTRNSVNDFYITRPGLKPIPHWLSQLYKK